MRTRFFTDSIMERIWDRVEPIDSGCWMWIGSKGADGYGHISWHHKRHRTHRLVYTMLRGPIPEELVLDHLCRVPLCVNPDHLEPVTRGENVRRGNRHSNGS